MNTEPSALLPLRLDPGSDLKQAIEAAARRHGIEAAFVVSGIGSLSRAAVRFANAPAATLLEGPFEILTLQGSVAPDGAHLHIAIADEKGAVLGGHVASGCTVHTTAEIVLTLLADHRFSRRHDERTGHRELHVERRG
jgi:predicted DNA-binding protein with PD1-like motif